MHYNQINFYQLDNLINNRVPFMFYNMSSSLTDWYTSVSRMHVTNHELLVKPDEVLSDVGQKKVPKDYAIVLLCNDGRTSIKLSSELEKLAYTNVYVVNGGYQQIVTERDQI
ncbi:MAG: rhodanese-like domain-containing protein [Pseudobdellovibrio sp.]